MSSSKELLNAFITRTIAEVPFVLALYASSLVASWAPGEIAVDDVGTNEGGALWAVAVCLVFGLEFFLTIDEFGRQLSRKKLTGVVDRNGLLAAAWRIERLVLYRRAEQVLQAVSTVVVVAWSLDDVGGLMLVCTGHAPDVLHWWWSWCCFSWLHWQRRWCCIDWNYFVGVLVVVPAIRSRLQRSLVLVVIVGDELP